MTVESIAGDTMACRLTSGQTLTAMSAGDPVVGAAGHASIRPENLTLTGAGGDASLTGVVKRLIYLGTDTQHLVRRSDGTELLVRSQNTQL